MIWMIWGHLHGLGILHMATFSAKGRFHLAAVRGGTGAMVACFGFHVDHLRLRFGGMDRRQEANTWDCLRDHKTFMKHSETFMKHLKLS